MTIEEVIKQVEEETGKKVLPITELKDVVDDSLDFLALMLRLNIPDEKVAGINTVHDLYLAAQ